MCKWIRESNRIYHLLIGFLSALFGTIIGTVEVACAMEGKDCQGDPGNRGLPPWKWTYRRWDWLDFLATMLGGLVGQALQVGIALLIHYDV